MRNTFVNTVTQMAEQDESIFLVCGDLGYSVLEPFANRFPDRFLNAGIAEQNMMGLASGLSREGYNVFVYSIGNFPTLRCMEQIRYDVCYHEQSVKVVAVGAGYAYGPLGTSHHTTEDLAMLRVLPGMVVAAPADPAEAEGVARWMCRHRGPGYVRINKAGEPRLHPGTIDFDQPRALPVRQGTKGVVLTTGATLAPVLALPRVQAGELGVVSFPFVKPLDSACLRQLAQDFPELITVEEHQRAGGFGSAVLEALNDLQEAGMLEKLPKVSRRGIADRFFGFAGTQEYLRDLALDWKGL